MRSLRGTTARRLLLRRRPRPPAGCAAVEDVAKVGTSVAESHGVDHEGAGAIDQPERAARREDGRGLHAGAGILHRPLRRGRSSSTGTSRTTNAQANDYLNLLGQALALASDRPETFGGYHFLVLDSDEINAFATPGGLIFVTRGMLRCCRNEDAVAAVLAHEIAHVAAPARPAVDREEPADGGADGPGGRGRQDVREEGARRPDQDVRELDRRHHLHPGQQRVLPRLRAGSRRGRRAILSRVGYDPNALVAMLREMGKRLKPGGADFAKTHPSPDSRIGDIRTLGVRGPASPAPPARQARFQRALGDI